VRALLLVSLVAILPACPGDDTCGPGAAAGDGLVLSGSGVEIRYHDLVASANNDCPDPAAPAGVVSLTIAGVQVGGTESITLCVPRPDLLADVRALGTDVQIIDLNATAPECTFVRNTTTPPTGTVTADGLCADGTDPAGFALVVQGTATVDRTCLAGTDTVTLDMAGTVSVATP